MASPRRFSSIAPATRFDTKVVAGTRDESRGRTLRLLDNVRALNCYRQAHGFSLLLLQIKNRSTSSSLISQSLTLWYGHCTITHYYAGIKGSSIIMQASSSPIYSASPARPNVVEQARSFADYCGQRVLVARERGGTRTTRGSCQLLSAAVDKPCVANENGVRKRRRHERCARAAS